MFFVEADLVNARPGEKVDCKSGLLCIQGEIQYSVRLTLSSTPD